MTEPVDPADAAAALLRAQGRVAPASAVPLVSVVRSGEQFLILPVDEDAEDLGPLHRLVLEWGYEVPRAQYAAFQTFLRDNNGLLSSPSETVPGLRYLGTYTVFQQSERSLGSFRTLWDFQRLSQMEEMSARVANADDAWGQAVKTLMGFRDPDYGAGRSQVILQLAAATII
ncbi:hypothetical protein [Roseomonas indoligenes]|uniref:Uncharacterized protein n=1 Tax=Roseomonas indoligenes TaxID=2820811 RepID=A0A940N2X9_9PROT|nr:hypothetical protein [Pararoseomonas indoligenes]MBP0496253.1 hypothetical protein [Pararoseomonas indoligenes]